MDDRVVWLVQCYIEDEWKDPSCRWSDWYFTKNAYSRWAAYEIVDLLKNRGDTSPIKIVKDFSSTMDDYSCMNNMARGIFSIARDAANDILDFLYAMEYV